MSNFLSDDSCNCECYEAEAAKMDDYWEGPFGGDADYNGRGCYMLEDGGYGWGYHLGSCCTEQEETEDTKDDDCIVYTTDGVASSTKIKNEIDANANNVLVITAEYMNGESKVETFIRTARDSDSDSTVEG